MDESEHSLLAGVPPDAFSLRLARSTIKMHHPPSWQVDKINGVHDLVVCLAGGGDYRVDGEAVSVEAGEAMLIPAGSHFVGRHAAGEFYSGFAQHFTLHLFGKVDIISQMRLKLKTRFARFDVIEPMARYYREIAPPATTVLLQAPLFMAILVQFLESAFIGWRAQTLANTDNPDALSLNIMLTAARISENPMSEDVLDQSLARLPYNADYFRRAFRERIGHTPQKFVEYKRLEQAMNWLSLGRSVKEAAALIGYGDVYYFSRQFKRYFGTSPSSFRSQVRTAKRRGFVEETGMVMGLPSALRLNPGLLASDSQTGADRRR